MNRHAISRRELFRSMLRSRFTQACVALAACALCVWLALLLWQGRDLVMQVITSLVILFGVILGWTLWPFSPETLARHARERQLAERYPSYRFRVALWVGLGQAAVVIVRGEHSLIGWLVPGAFLASGAVSYAVWHFRCRRDNIGDA